MEVNLKVIEGNWDQGIALDKHSVRSIAIGTNEYGHTIWDTLRTEAGEAVYQLKYQKQYDQVQVLADAVIAHIVPHFPKIGMVIPMPASTVRARQPVTEVADAIAKKLGQPMFDEILIKTRNGKSLKNLNNKEEKIQALAGTIQLNRHITNEGRWNVLLVDDLYQSGASLEAACAVLRTYEKIGKIYVAALTWRF